MYPRGRTGGRDRSRDPSRTFPGSGRVERDYNQRSNYRSDRDRDGQYNRTDEGSFGRWGGGGGGAREGREGRDGGRERESHPPPPPPLGVPSPAHPATLPPPAPLLSDQQSSYTREQSSVLSRRGSITREPLPSQDSNSRRQSGVTSTRKEFTEPSPRERGMIADSQSGHLPRRQTGSGSWGGDDRARSETQRNSAELNNSNRLSRSPAESPRSVHPAASPTTSTVLTPTTSNSTINFTSMPPSALAYSAATSHNGGKEQRYATIFQEASFAYFKYIEAQSNFKSADKESRDHAEHFNLFPVMKERYEGNARAAKKQLNIAHEALRNKSAPLDELCQLLFKEHAVHTGTENAVVFFQKIQKELGNGSLAQFVKSNAPAPTSAPLGPSKSDFEQLREELWAMKKKQEEEEKMRQNLTNEFHNYKNSQAEKTRNCITKSQELRSDIQRVKDSAAKTGEELKTAVSLLTEVMGDVRKLQEAAKAKSSADVEMNDAVNDGTVSEKVKKVVETVETIQKTLITTQQKMSQTASKCASDIKVLEQKVSQLDVRDAQASQIQGALALQEYATKSDISRLEQHMHQQDNLIDSVRVGIEGDTALVSETVQSLGATLDQNNQETAERIKAVGDRVAVLETTLEQNYKETAGKIQVAGERVRAFEHAWKDQVTNLTSRHKSAEALIFDRIKTIDKNLDGIKTKLATDIEVIGGKVSYVESHLEGHTMAISHLDQRMTNFTTKDFYERVLQELIKINPMMFNQTHQMNGIYSEIKAMRDTLRNLGHQMKQQEQRIASANISPRSAPDTHSAQDGPSGGGLKSDSSEGSNASLTSAIADIDTLRTRVEGIDKELKEHIAAYTKKINDIKNWTISASERLALHTESAAAISEDIRALRDYLGSLNSPVQIPNSTGNSERWRAVPNYQGDMSAIPSSSTEDVNTAGNNNGNGNF